MNSSLTHIGLLSKLSPDKLKLAINSKPIDEAVASLAELFRGNGWTVAVHPHGRNTPLLLSDPRKADEVILIVKLLTKPHPVSYAEAHEELVDFETNIGPLYSCSQFCLISMNGYERNADKLEGFNMLLQDWSAVEELLKTYSKDKHKAPNIQLFAHNKQTYQKVRRMMQHNKAVAVVQATGTGKSYVIARLLQDFDGQKRLVMAPSHFVIDQVKEHIRWDDSIEFMTYMRGANLTDAEVRKLQPKLIVLDEFHRCGADEWGRGVQNIIDAHPNAFKFGTSATPIRYLDNGRDMSMELFDGHVAENLSLSQAIVRNILPMPKYVCALYTISEEVSTMRSRIERSRKTEQRKRELTAELDAFHLDWEMSRGIPQVLKKHLRAHMRKFIVFCKDEPHLAEMAPIVRRWFRDALGEVRIRSFIVHSGEEGYDENFQAFKNEQAKDEIHLLFSINMLNEGLHVNEVNGVILLRPTESPNIFYQQIGRCLKVGMAKQPVIFDFINNFRTIRTHDFMYDLEQARKDFSSVRQDESLSDRCPRFTVHDEVREIVDVFGEIRFRVDNWPDYYERLVEFKKKFGHCEVPTYHPEYKDLWSWLFRQKQRHYFGKLNEEKYRQLENLSVNWNYIPVDKLWDKRYSDLQKFFDKHGHSNVPVGDKVLFNWISKQRGHFKSGGMDAKKIDKLKDVNFEFNPEDARWERQFEKLYAHYMKKGNVTVRYIEDNLLSKWCIRQRHNHRKGIMTEYQFKKLSAINFEFVVEYKELHDAWKKKYNELVAYQKKHGHCNVAEHENERLETWVGIQRRRFAKKKLLPERQKKLQAIDFEWSRRGDAYFDKKIAEMLEIKEKKGKFILSTSYARSLRLQYQEGTLPEHHVKKLQAIGFPLQLNESYKNLRERRIRQLADFKKKYGHCNVTTKHTDFHELLEWCLGIRKQHNRGTLRKDTQDILNSMGFKWDYKSEWLSKRWNDKYRALVEYHKKHGTTDILKESKELDVLQSWCTTQRTNYKSGKLSKERFEKLDALNFDWSGKRHYIRHAGSRWKK